MDTMTITEAAEALGLTHDGVMKLIHRGTLPAQRVGPRRRGIWLIEAAVVEAEKQRRRDHTPTGRGRPPQTPPD